MAKHNLAHGLDAGALALGSRDALVKQTVYACTTMQAARQVSWLGELVGECFGLVLVLTLTLTLSHTCAHTHTCTHTHTHTSQVIV